MEKMPPKAKIYEAFSCIADNRILLKENEATVTSSDNKKTYTVKWKENEYSSTDNATFWQGYPGYPVISVLMLQNKLSYPQEIASLFKNINWHALNEKYKRDYEKAITEVLENINANQEQIKKEVDTIYEELSKLNISIKRKIN